MDVQPLHHRFTDRHARIKRSVRVLKDDLHLTASRFQFARLQGEYICPATTTEPEVGSIRRSMVRPTVVLPQPDSPTNPKVSPSAQRRKHRPRLDLVHHTLKQPGAHGKILDQILYFN